METRRSTLRLGTHCPITRRPGRRGAGALAAGALAAALWATPALAGSENLFFLGTLGGPPQGTFGPNEVIRFSGKLRFINACLGASPGGPFQGAINDFAWPATDVYVVAGSVPPADGATLLDAGGVPSVVIEFGSAGFESELLAITVPGGKLGAGTYSVVYDTCQDGRFNVAVTLALSQPSGWDTVARLITSDGTALAGTDYRAADLFVPMPAGSTTSTVHLGVIGNTIPQPDRQFTVTVSGLTHLPAAASSATVTILDDDPVQLLLSSASVAAGETALLRATAPGLPAGESVTFGWTTADGSAAAGTDYTSSSGTLSVGSGQTATLAVPTSATAGAAAAASGIASLQLIVRATPAAGGRVVLAPAPASVRITGLAAAGDQVPPVVTGTPDRAPNAAGWYRAPVTVTWTAVDAVDGVVSPPPPSVIAAEGNGTGSPTLSAPACDKAGNCARGSYGPLKLDLAPPSVAISGVRDGAVYPARKVPVAACAASDALSGLAGPCQITVAGGPQRTGRFTATATATDVAGNVATATASYRVVCALEDDRGDGHRTRDHHDRRAPSRARERTEGRGGDRSDDGTCEDEKAGRRNRRAARVGPTASGRSVRSR